MTVRSHQSGCVPNALMAEYYRQRSSDRLILTEATSVSPKGVGYADTPGIWSDEQVEGWRAITRTVHEQRGHIAVQLWHVGRVSDPLFLNGETPIAPSAIRLVGHMSLVRPMKEFVTPQALAGDEIHRERRDTQITPANKPMLPAFCFETRCGRICLAA